MGCLLWPTQALPAWGLKEADSLALLVLLTLRGPSPAVPLECRARHLAPPQAGGQAGQPLMVNSFRGWDCSPTSEVP